MHSPHKNVPIDESELVLLLVNNIKDYAIFALDPEGYVQTWNDGANKLKQYTLDEIRGQHFSIFYTDQEIDLNKPQSMLEIARQYGKAEEEGWRVRKDGSRFWAHILITAIFDDNRNLRGFAKVTQDISEKKLSSDREKLLFDIAFKSAQAVSFLELLHFVVEKVGAFLDWQLGHAYLWSDNTQCLKSTKVWYSPKESDNYQDFRIVSEAITFETGIGLPGRCLQSKRVIYIADVGSDPNFLRKPALKKIDLHSLLLIPVIVSGNVIAVLEFFSRNIVLDIKPVVEIGEIVSLQVSRFLERQRIVEEQEMFFGASKDLLCFAGFDGYFKRASPSWMNILGYEVEEVLKIPWADFVHPDDMTVAAEAGRSQIEKGATVTIELRFRHKDGSYRWLQWHSVPILDREIIYAIGRDITDQKLVEDQLQETLSLQNAILQGSPYAILSVDLTGIVRAFNRGAEELFGYKAEEFIGLSNRPSLTDKDTWAMRSASLSDRLGKKLEYGLDVMVTLASLNTREEFEWDYVRKDGTKFPALLAVSSLLDENNQVTGYVGIVQDLTARRHAEAEKNRLLTVLENSPSLICFGEPGGPILYQNKGGNKILGLSDGESIVGMNAALFQPEWARKVVVEQAFPALEDSGFWEGETAVLNREGVEVPVVQILMTLPAMPGEPKFIASIVRDISEAKRAEVLLQQQALDLRHSNEELEQFAFVASHDLQEPLRMVCSFLGLLELEHKDQLNEEGLEYINFAIDGGLRMRALIDGLLDFSRVGRQNLTLVPIDLSSIVSDSLDNLKIAVKESGAEIVCGDLPIVMADQGTLTRVIQNLIGNALKFRGVAPAKIQIAARDLGSEIEVSIQDNGIGIDPKHDRKIFLIFQQLHSKSKYPGSGIGLAICKKIIERHGGRIWLDHDYMNGAKFCFTLQKEPNIS